MQRQKTYLMFSFFLAITVPFLPLLLWSVSESWLYPALMPTCFGLRAWTYIVSDPGGQFARGLFTSFSLAILTMCVSLLFGIPVGRAMGLYHFPGKKLIIFVLALPLLIPPLAVSMGIHHWFLRLNLTETFLGVLLIHLAFSLPYAILVLWGSFNDYNPEFEEQARTLGASPLIVFFQVTLPMIAPGITVAMVFTFLVSWAQYLSTLIIGGGKVLSLPILLFALMDSGDRPVAAAASLVFILPSFLILFASTHNLSKATIEASH